MTEEELKEYKKVIGDAMSEYKDSVGRVGEVSYSDQPEDRPYYVVKNNVTKDYISGFYGNFLGSLLYTKKEYVGTFPLYFESEATARRYMREEIFFRNAFEPDDDKQLTESDFEIIEKDYEGSGMIIKFKFI